MQMQQLAMQGAGMEVVYAFVIIICSLMVYISTRELYRLTSHKGIRYFRMAFLFFAIAYFVRSIIKFIIINFNLRAVMDFHIRSIGPITLFFFMYFSSMAIFYLLYSVKWRDFKDKMIYLFHGISVVIAGVILLIPSNTVYLIINILLLAIFAFVILTSRKQEQSRKKKNSLHVVYILLSVFWILNILDILIPNIVKTYQTLIYLASLFIFLLILYKVLRKTGAD